MGSCISSNYVIKEHKNKFLKSNVVDKENNVIIGIYSNTNQYKQSNTLINQGICIGNNNQINKIKFGIIHRNINYVELYFENDIKLIYTLEPKNKMKMELTFNNNKIEKYISLDSIKQQYKLINDNSEYIDLVYDLSMTNK